jgi:methanethiol S-methyltransferase
MFKRLSFFVYGLVSYLVFLGTFLYAMAFVGGFLVPTRLDGPATGAFAVSLAIDVALLTVFAVQHSVMARRWFKAWLTQYLPEPLERSTYVLCASLALMLVFWQWRPLGGVVWSVENPIAQLALWAAFASGWLLVLAVTWLINHFDLFGMRQVWLYLLGRPYTKVTFTTPGPYRVVRHPLYFGFLIAFWMTPTMTVAHLVFAVVTTAYIVTAIQFEERDLVAEHPGSYEGYRRRVPMLVPGSGGRRTSEARTEQIPVVARD